MCRIYRSIYTVLFIFAFILFISNVSSFSDRSRLPEKFCKKGILKNFAKFHRKIPLSEPLFNKVAGLVCNFIKKEILTKVFSKEFCEIFKNTFIHRTLPVASVLKNVLLHSS